MRLSAAAALVLGLSVLAATTPLFADSAPATTTTKAKADANDTESAPARVAVLKLTAELQEKPNSFKFSLLDMNPAKTTSLPELLGTLGKIKTDSTISGVLLDLQSFTLTLSQAQELSQQLQDLRHAKKRVAVFANDYEMASYVLASSADTVIMPENGSIMIPGIRLELMFYKGLFDKLNVQADMVQIGKFKGAEEPYTRADASPEFQAQIQGLVDAFYSQLTNSIAAHRQLAEKEAVAAVDEGWIPGKRARELGLVDHLMNRPAVDKWFETQFPNGVEMVKDYGTTQNPKIDLDNPFAFFQLLGQPKNSTRTRQKAIAVVVASGEIIDDRPGSENDDQYITPAGIRKSLDKALRDPLVKEIVLRVDSPGGSASASDDIWQMLKEADKKKPVTVSMGRVAASGGYYISCAGRSITADQATITGSIGVVGGKFVMAGLFDKVGLTVQPFSKGKHAGMFSAVEPFSAEERTFVEGLMRDTYHIFTDRVKAGRGDKVKAIDDVAQGRLFDGDAAKKVGLVDTVGTLNDTIRAAAKDAKIDDDFQVLLYPEAKTLPDILRESFGIDTQMPANLQAIIQTLPPEYRTQVANLLTMCRTLQQNKVLLAAPTIIEH